MRKAREQSVVEHAAGALAALFGRLTDEHDRARPADLVAGQILGHADQVGHVDVVAAGVHHADRRAVLVLHLDLRGVGQAGVLDDRQRIEIGPQHQRRPGAVLEHAHDAVAADAGVHFDAGLFPELGQPGGGFLFLRGQLRLLVQVAVKFNQLAGVLRGPIGRSLGPRVASEPIAANTRARVAS